MSTLNICVTGQTSVGKTTLISILINKTAGIIKRSRSTLNFNKFIESDDLIDLDMNSNDISNIISNNISNNKINYQEMKIIKIPPIKCLDKTHRNYKISIIDSIGFDDIEIDNTFYKSIEDSLDVIIFMIDVGKNLSKADKCFLEMINKQKNVICICNKFDDINDDELNDNLNQLKKILIDEQIVKNENNIIGMSCDSIYNLLITRNEKKIKCLYSLYDTNDENKILELCGYNKFIEELNNLIISNHNNIWLNKLDYEFKHMKNLNDFYVIHSTIEKILPNINKINYYIDDLPNVWDTIDKNNRFQFLTCTESHRIDSVYVDAYDEYFFDDVLNCINNFEEHVIEKILGNYYHSFCVNDEPYISYFKMIDKFGESNVIFNCLLVLITSHLGVTYTELDVFDLDEYISVLNSFGNIIIKINNIEITNVYIFEFINDLIYVLIKRINYKLSKNNCRQNNIYKILTTLKYFTLKNISICEIFFTLQTILILQFNNHESNINNFILDYDNMSLCDPLEKFEHALIKLSECVHNQTDKIWISAVQSNGLALKYVKEQTDKICELAVQSNGLALKYVKEQTDKICEIAVKSDGMALEFVHNQTEEICKLAVQSNGYALKYVHNQTEEICKLAIQQNKFVSIYVRN